jgi:predicted 2-oxoglutarate/Fe(II)-dependent dioxygenase YbiX
LVFGNSYTTNISANITINSLVVNDPAAYESLVLVVKNTDSAAHTVTFPNGTCLIPANVAPAVAYATNGVFTEIDIAHQGSVYTNVTVKN